HEDDGDPDQDERQEERDGHHSARMLFDPRDAGSGVRGVARAPSGQPVRARVDVEGAVADESAQQQPTLLRELDREAGRRADGAAGGGAAIRTSSRAALPHTPQEEVRWNRRSPAGSRRRPRTVRTSTTFAARSSVGPTARTSPRPAIRPSPARKPTASSSS